MDTIDVKIIYDINSDTFDVSGNAKDPKSIVSNFLRTQVGRGVDKNPANNHTVYTILINLDPSEDIFSISHDCGNKGLREGILMRFLKCPCATDEQEQGNNMVTVKGNHPLAEILAKKLFGIETVPAAEQRRMVNRAIKAAVKYVSTDCDGCEHAGDITVDCMAPSLTPCPAGTKKQQNKG